MTKKVCLITGASEGIGLAIAVEFAQQGFRVVLAARDFSKSVETLKTKFAHKEDVFLVPTDITDEAQCQRLIAQTLDACGQLDVVVLNASITHRSLVEDTDMRVLRQVFEVNFWGNAYLTQLAIPHLAKTKGSFIAITGTSAIIPLPGRSAYCASKFAQEGFFGTIRGEVQKHDINVCIVRPTYTATSIRKNALLADGTRQANSSLEEDKLHTAEYVAQKTYLAYAKRLRDYNLSGKKGSTAIFLYKFFPKWVEGIVRKSIDAEKNPVFSLSK